MEFAEKLKRLLGVEDQAGAAARAGIPTTTFSSYCTGKTRPTAEAAVRLAKAFHRDLLWLLDDERDWVDVDLPASLEGASDEAIVTELRRRYVEAAIKLHGTLRKAGRVDWEQMALSMAEAPSGTARTNTSEAIDIYFDIINDQMRWGALASAMDFQPWAMNKEIPKGFDPAELTPEALANADRALSTLSAGFRIFIDVLGWKMVERSGKHDTAEIEEARNRARQGIAKLEARNRPHKEPHRPRNAK